MSNEADDSRAADDDPLAFLSVYVDAVRKELKHRWGKWHHDLTNREVHEVVGALLARHVSIVTNAAAAPQILNPHIMPMLLRGLSDAYITLAWIVLKPEERSRQFISHGLGEFKLWMEWRREQVRQAGADPETDKSIKSMEHWLNSQRFEWLTEVNVGAWSGVNTRQMADEADCSNVYNLAFKPFSACTHNMWHHVALYNLRECENPLHRHHRVPADPPLEGSVTYLVQAADLVDRAFRLTDQKFGIGSEVPSAFDELIRYLEMDSEDDAAPQ